MRFSAMESERRGRTAPLLLALLSTAVGFGAQAQDAVPDAPAPDCYAALAQAAPPPASADVLAAVFQPPSAGEAADVRACWEEEAVAAEAVARVDSLALGRRGQLVVVGHDYDGWRHYGLVRVPAGGVTPGMPLVVLLHGGSGGVGGGFANGLPPEIRDRVLVAAPAFRGEPARLRDRAYVDERAFGPDDAIWEADVRDALAFVEAVRALYPQADPRPAFVGVSRGGTVALLAAARTEDARGVFVASAPTDFFSEDTRARAQHWLETETVAGGTYGRFEEAVFEPLRRGERSPAWARVELLRRSPRYVAGALPPVVHLHYGSADEIVPVEHGDLLYEALVATGYGAPDLVFVRHPEAGHGLFHALDVERGAFLREVFPQLAE